MPCAFRQLTVNRLGAGPALGRAEHDHGPPRPLVCVAASTCRLLDVSDPIEHRVQRLGHLAMHRSRLVALHEEWLVAVTLEQALELVAWHTRQDSRAGDLVAVKVQDGQHRPVVHRVEELVRVPGCRERACLRLAVADHAGDQQVGVVECGAKCMRQRVAEFTAFVDRPRCFGRCVARNAAWKRELLQQPTQTLDVLRHGWVELAISTLEIRVGDHARSAVARAAHIDGVEIALPDDAIQVHVDEVETRRRTPVPKQPRLDVFGGERLDEQRIVEQVDLTDRQVVGSPPIGVHAVQQVFRDSDHNAALLPTL
jgi:hypothetical protein